MDRDSALSLVLLIAVLGLFALIAAGEAVLFAARWRLRALEKNHTEAVRHYARERDALLGAVLLVRNAAVVGATALALYLAFELTDRSWAAVAVTGVAGLILLTALETLPRLLVARNPDRWIRLFEPVASLLRRLFGRAAGLLEIPVRLLLPGAEQARSDEGDELLRLVEMEESQGGIEADEREMIRSIFELEDTIAREVMVPRIDIVAISTEETVDDALALVVEKGFSRLPLYEDTIDNIVGVIYAKDLIRCLAEGRRPPLKEVARPPHFVPESKKADELLDELRKDKVHIAIVVDEYGGTAGIVTIEDLIEEIVGEIQDEYDVEEPTIEMVSETEAIVDARVSLDQLNEMFHLGIEGEDYDTVGGFLYDRLGKVPSPGDEVAYDGVRLHVLSVLGHRIKKVRVERDVFPAADSRGNGEG